MPSIARAPQKSGTDTIDVTTTYQDGTVTSTENVTSFLYSDYELNKTWSRDPLYKQKLKTRQRLNDNNFSYQMKFSNTGGFVGIQRRSYPAPTVVSTVSTISVDANRFTRSEGDVVLTDFAVKAKALNKARGQDVNLPLIVAEGRKTGEMIANSAYRLAYVYRNLRKGAWKQAAEALGISTTPRKISRYNQMYGKDPVNAASSIWLEWRYGWTPLLHDVYDAASTLASLQQQEWANRTTVRARDKQNTVEVFKNHLTGSSPILYSTYRTNSDEEYRLVWEFKPNWSTQLSQLGLLNPLSVAWELVPYSFVVDWFIPLGDYFEGLDVPMNVTHIGGVIGYRREFRGEYQQFNGPEYTECLGNVLTRYLIINRTKLSSSPTPAFDSLRFDPKLGAKRITDAISLLAQAFGRR